MWCNNYTLITRAQQVSDRAVEESANLPASEIIADLEAALEQFAPIAEDLKR